MYDADVMHLERTFIPMPRAEACVRTQREHVLLSRLEAESDGGGVVEAHVKSSVSALVRHQILAVQKKSSVVEDTFKVQECCATVGLPLCWKEEVLPVPVR
jgi:hypothetical protein